MLPENTVFRMAMFHWHKWFLKIFWHADGIIRHAGSKAPVCWGAALLSSLLECRITSWRVCKTSGSGKWQGLGCAGSATPRESRTRWACCRTKLQQYSRTSSPAVILHLVWIHLMLGCLWFETWLTENKLKLNAFMFHIHLKGIHYHTRNT
jgi:hypothetical protein